MSETRAQPSEDEMRAAYEAELNRITSTEMILQTVVSLVNLGGRRLGLAGGPDTARDLDQVADAIDGARALMPVLERRMPREIGPLRDAISQLQMAYAREVRETGGASQADEERPDAQQPAGQPPNADRAAGRAQAKPEGTSPGSGAESAQRRPGPAESSGRLWVPGR